MDTDSEPRMVGSTRTTFRIIESLRNFDNARVTELAEELELSKSSVYRHLATLRDMEYVVKDGNYYRLSLRFLDLGEYTKRHREDYRLAKLKIQSLVEETDEGFGFIVEEHGYGVYVHKEMGENAVETGSNLGKRMHLHTTASGKALLSKLPPDRVSEIFDNRGLPAVTKHSITVRDEMYRELEKIRDRGYSISDQENIVGLRAVSVPVVDVNDQPVGAIVTSGPTSRYEGEYLEEELPNRLKTAANELELEEAFDSGFIS